MSRMSEMADKLAAKTTSGTKVAVLSLVKFLEEIGWGIRHGIILVDVGDRKFTGSTSYGLNDDVRSAISQSTGRRDWVQVVGITDGYLDVAPHREDTVENLDNLLAAIPLVPSAGEKARVRRYYRGDLRRHPQKRTMLIELYEAFEGWQVTASDGETYDLPKGKAAQTGQFLRWAYKHGLAEDAAGFDPEAEAERIAESRTREGTGTCPVCFRNIKMKQKRGKRVPAMVLHGYKRPRWGYVVGNCPGTGWPPYEFSDEGTRSYVKDVEKTITATKGKLAKLKKAKTLSRMERDYSTREDVKKTYREGHYEFQRLKESMVHSLEVDIRHLENERDAMESAIAVWEERTPPLNEFQVNQILSGKSPKMRRGMR